MTGTNNFMAKAFDFFANMDKMLGRDFERGLADMKTAAEASVGMRMATKPASSAATSAT
jgi:hypothetical protein